MFDFIFAMSLIEIFGLISGLLAVWLLIKQNIWTWPIGIAYAVASLYIFYNARLYADLALHIFYLIMNFYGWYYWVRGGPRTESTLSVSSEKNQTILVLLTLCAIVIFISGTLFATYTDAEFPYWDNTTSVLSLLAMWLQSRKKLECWALWLLIDILASGIYFYKEIYFYSLLYIIYMGMAFMGYIAWHKSYCNEH